MYLEIFPADFAVFRGILRKYLNFAGPQPRDISEALQSWPWTLKLITLKAIEGTWISTGGYRQFREEWINKFQRERYEGLIVIAAMLNE